MLWPAQRQGPTHHSRRQEQQHSDQRAHITQRINRQRPLFDYAARQLAKDNPRNSRQRYFVPIPLDMPDSDQRIWRGDYWEASASGSRRKWESAGYAKQQPPEENWRRRNQQKVSRYVSLVYSLWRSVSEPWMIKQITCLLELPSSLWCSETHLPIGSVK